MASYGQAVATVPAGAEDERAPRQAPGERPDGVEPIDVLPGVINDLPEVAPHEWIYLMS